MVPAGRRACAAWLETGAHRLGFPPRRDPQGFAQLTGLCDPGPGGLVPETARGHTLRRAAVIVAAKGGLLAGIDAGDLLELLDTEADALGAVKAGAAGCYRVLRQLGIFGPAAPMRLRELRTAGQRTPEEMIDRHNLACRPIRDLLVDYLRERQAPWITEAWNSWPAVWACSGPTWKPTTPASTACT